MKFGLLIRYAAIGACALTVWALSPSAQATTVDVGYQIRPGDTLSVTVFGDTSLTQPSVHVLPGGTIAEPLAGQVRVGGLTPAQAGDAVARALSKYVRHPQVTVSVEQLGVVEVYVLGNVRTPGKYELQPASRLMDALAAAGGLGPTDGDLPDARLSIGDALKTVSLERLLHAGDLTLNAPVENQMAIYIPAPATFMVMVNGAVDHPGEIPMHEGDRLVNAIARAGTSSNANADLNHVLVRHRLPDGTISSQTVNMYDIYKNGDGSKDIVLAKGDTVLVPQGNAHRTSPLDTIMLLLGRFI